MTVVMLLVCQTRRGDFGYIGGHMQWSYVYVQLSDCGVPGLPSNGSKRGSRSLETYVGSVIVNHNKRYKTLVLALLRSFNR